MFKGNTRTKRCTDTGLWICRSLFFLRSIENWASGLRLVQILSFCFLAFVKGQWLRSKLTDSLVSLTLGSLQSDYWDRSPGSQFSSLDTFNYQGESQNPFHMPGIYCMWDWGTGSVLWESIIQFRCLLYFRLNGTILIQTINSTKETQMSQFLKGDMNRTDFPLIPYQAAF